MIDRNWKHNPLYNGGRWKGRVPIVIAVAGACIGYAISRLWFVPWLIGQATAEGRMLPWQEIARYIGLGTILGMAVFCVLHTTFEQLMEWVRYRRDAARREQTFTEYLGHPPEKK